MQREQYLREKKEGSDAYRKALDTQVNFQCSSLDIFTAMFPKSLPSSGSVLSSLLGD